MFTQLQIMPQHQPVQISRRPVVSHSMTSLRPAPIVPKKVTAPLANKENTVARSKVVKSHNTFSEIQQQRKPLAKVEPTTSGHSELYMNKRAQMKRNTTYPTINLEDHYELLTPRMSSLSAERAHLKSMEQENKL